jgi:hypothetical protein
MFLTFPSISVGKEGRGNRTEGGVKGRDEHSEEHNVTQLALIDANQSVHLLELPTNNEFQVFSP